MFRLPNTGLAIAVATLLASNIASAQFTVTWNGSVSTDWGVDDNWDVRTGETDPFVPEAQFNEGARIDNGGTSVVSGVFNSTSAKQGPGGLEVTSGILSILDSGELTLVTGPSHPNREASVSSGLHIAGAGELNVGTLTFGNAAILDIDLTAGTTSPINATASVSLNGTLDLDYSGVASPGGSQTLVTAGSVNGAFSSINITGLNAAQTVAVNSSVTSVDAVVVNLPTLTIDRDSGTATITNTHGTPISMDGFSISSNLGALGAAQFSGMPRSGWDPAGGNSSTVVADTYEGPNVGTPADSIPSSTPLQVGGSGFWSLPEPQYFQDPTEELVFEFTDPGLNEPIRGVVEYTGTQVVNNDIVLYIDNSGADKGMAAMLNESGFAQDVEVYRVGSTGDPLQTGTWSPLANQVGLDNDTWQVSTQSNASALIEVTESGSSNFDQFTRFDIGQILASGFTNESGISFEFLLAGDEEFTTGTVYFIDEIPLADAMSSPGDFNGDNVVDGQDYALWRESLGGAASLINNNGTPGATTVLSADFAIWKDNYGANYGGGSAPNPAPEPATSGLLALLVGSVATLRRRSQLA